MKKIIFIKLGGGLITNKNIPYSLKTDVIKAVTEEIGQAIAKYKNTKFVLGHGTGSFGHPIVKEYNLEKGIGRMVEQKKLGFAKVENSVLKLNTLINDYLLNQKLHTFPIHPSSIIISNNNQVTDIFIDPLIKLMELGMIPLVHGDMVYDEKLGSTIISTEQLFLLLVRKLTIKNYQIDKIIYLSNIDGVLDKKGNLIKKISKNNYKNLLIEFNQTNGIDVTGGMRNKVEIGFKIASQNIKTLIINGNRKGNLIKAIEEKEFTGTVIE